MPRLQTMLTAFDAASNRLTIGDVPDDELQALSKQRHLSCTHCRGRVVYRKGTIRIPHFAHWRVPACVDRYGEPDGPDHRAMKRLVVDWLRRCYPDATVDMEVTITQTGQRADVLLRTTTGEQVAVEVQVSPLTDADWLERHLLYRQAGIVDIWLLHERHHRECDTWGPANGVYAAFADLGGYRATLSVNTLQQTMVASGAPITYLAPSDQQASGRQLTRLLAPRTTSPTRMEAVVVHKALDACTLGPHEVMWPALSAAQAAVDAAERNEADLRARRAARPGSMWGEPGPPRSSAVDLLRHEAHTEIAHRLQRRAAALEEWRWVMHEHPVWQDLVRTRHVRPDPSVLPSVFGAAVPGADQLGVAPELWQADLFYQLVNGQPTITDTAADWATYVCRRFDLSEATAARLACEEFWHYLAYVGLLRTEMLFAVGGEVTAWCPCSARVVAAKHTWALRVRDAVAQDVLQTYPALAAIDLVQPAPVPPYTCRRDCTLAAS